MITPELIGYIRGELGKGRKREDIRESLVREGGWSEVDLSEAFRIVMPMQGATAPAPAETIKSAVSSASASASALSSASSLSSPSPSALRKVLLMIIVILVVGGMGFSAWIYRAPLIEFWNQGAAKIKELSASLFGSKIIANTENSISPVPENIETPVANAETANIVVTVKDCGVGKAPDIKKPATYQNDAVLNCLGESAILCAPAKAVLKDALFPTVVEITKNQGGCDFKLSYAADSTLIDRSGEKLAGQYVLCPLSVVKAVDESKKTPSFNPPSADNLGKYAGQIYFYGTLGLFMENNLERNKIHSLGCTGSFIDSVIASFEKMQSNTR